MTNKCSLALFLILTISEIDASLHQAVKNREIGTIRQLLANNADVNQRDENGDTPLLIECKYSQDTTTDVLDLLLGANANIMQQDANKHSSITYTAHRGMTQKMKALIAKVGTLQGCYGITSFAAQSGNTDMITMLVAARAPLRSLFSKSPLEIAVYRNDLTMAQRIIELGINTKESILEDGYLLAIAIERQHHDMLKLLLNHGANPNRSQRGETPLMSAVLKKDIASVRTLIEAGANLNDIFEYSEHRHPAQQSMNQNHAVCPYVYYQESVLRLAEKHSTPEIVQLLKSKGAKRNWDCSIM